MRRTIFLDVGGHRGQSVAIALQPRWTFDVVHTFEPHPRFAQHIRERFADAIASGRLVVHEAALAGADGHLHLADDNEGGGASTISGLQNKVARVLRVPAVDVNRFLAGFGADDTIYMKLNCEGGEVAILERMLEYSGSARIAAVVADFDIVKQGFGYYTKRRVYRQALAAGLPIVLSEKVMVGRTHADRLTNWLLHHPEIATPGTVEAPKPQRKRRVFTYFLRDLRSSVGIGSRKAKRKEQPAQQRS